VNIYDSFERRLVWEEDFRTEDQARIGMLWSLISSPTLRRDLGEVEAFTLKNCNIFVPHATEAVPVQPLSR
jgi:hypothetical protein